MNTIRIDSGAVRMVAHRGVSGLEAENTNSAFVAAGNRSYYGIETDVHRTLDGAFVCIHDSSTARVGLDNLIVEDSTFDTLRALVLLDKDGKRGRIDLRIPTLGEYIRICRKYEKTGVLELKKRIPTEDIRRIVDEIRAEDYLDGIIFISFNLENLLDLRAMLPEQPIQYLTSAYSPELVDTLLKERLDLDIDYTALTEENVRYMHEQGIRINCWTVDDPAAAADLVRWGVDYITSNILE